MVSERYSLRKDVVEDVSKNSYRFGYGGFGEIVYYTNYSRLRKDGSQERWIDTCTRVVEGVFSVRKDHYLKNGLKWDNAIWDSKAAELLHYIYTLKLLPPGRGLWAQGTDYVYNNGSMALNNCAGCGVYENSFYRDLGWVMDALMCGCGVGVRYMGSNTLKNLLELSDDKIPFTMTIEDSREGWVDSVVVLLESYTKKSNLRVSFDYSNIRKKGEKIKGFGGVSSGYEPLEILHGRIRKFMDKFISGQISATRLIADLSCSIASCVVAGNVRRSAIILLGDINDSDFHNLKNYEINPDRMDIGYLSNNTVVLENNDDFLKIDKLIDNICTNGEPGFLNIKNVQKYERFGCIDKPDKAFICNPCGEIGLEDKEFCNVSEIFPSKAKSKKEFLKLCELAALYTTSVSLLPTHNEDTNSVIARNRRIGNSISGVADWFDTWGAFKIVKFMREGYSRIKEYSNYLNSEAGVPNPIRVTTVKPSGTVSLLSGVSPGMHFPLYTYAIRRMRFSEGNPILSMLEESGIPVIDDYYDSKNKVIEYPIFTGNTRQSHEVSAWEQFSLLALLQREWSDNLVSSTITFNKDEAKDLKRMLAHYLPLIKSVSLLPSGNKVYPQMPYEGIDEKEYAKRVEKLKSIDWSKLTNTGLDGKEELFCSNDSCLIK